MNFLRLALGLFLIVAVILYFIRPAEPVAGRNDITYDGETLALNGRATSEANLRAMEFPQGSEIVIYLKDAKDTSLGSKAGLLYHWDKKGIKHYFTVDGVPLRVDTLTWRRATNQELNEEIEAENTRRQAKVDLHRNRQIEEAETQPNTIATEEDEAPVAPEIPEAARFIPYEPTDKNRYYWNGELIGNAAQTEARLKQVSLTRPGALVVMTPKFDSPPANVKSVEALGFSPVVTKLLKRAGGAGIFVRLHRGQGFEPPKPTKGSAGMLGGLFYAYLGPLIFMVGGVFLVSWFMESGRAQHEK